MSADKGRKMTKKSTKYIATKYLALSIATFFMSFILYSYPKGVFYEYSGIIGMIIASYLILYFSYYVLWPKNDKNIKN